MLNGYAVVTITAGLCLSIVVGRIVCVDVETMTPFGSTPTMPQRTAGNFSGDLTIRSRRFVVVNGDGVPDYDGVDDDDDHVVYDYDDGGGSDHDHDYHDIEHDDDDDHDFDYGSGPGYHHHVWWHHYYHHGEPHLPFPLFPPVFVHRRPIHRRCDRWPFVCRSTYEVIQWLQCYHEFLDESGIHHEDNLHGLVGVPTHAWRK